MAQEVAARLHSQGFNVAVRYTARSGDAEHIARDVSLASDNRPDCVAACGGDGTIHEVANALASARLTLGDSCPAMGLAPAGRCNDFARVLGILPDPATVADVLARGRQTPMDLGRVNHRFFCTVATIGVDAEVTSFVDSMRLPLRGTPAYLYGALRVLLRYRPPTLRIDGDFGTIEKPLLIASTANTSSYGGAIPIAPDADPTDGQLDLCAIEPVSTWRALTLVPTVLRGRHGQLPEVKFIRTRSFTIDAEEDVELWADGEHIGHTPAKIEIAPGAVHVMLPDSPE